MDRFKFSVVSDGTYVHLRTDKRSYEILKQFKFKRFNEATGKIQTLSVARINNYIGIYEISRYSYLFDALVKGHQIDKSNEYDSLDSTGWFTIHPRNVFKLVAEDSGYQAWFEEIQAKRYKKIAREERALRKALKIGYKSTREKLIGWFFDDQPALKSRARLIVAERATVRRERVAYRKRYATLSTRMINRSRIEMDVVYPSQRKIPANVKIAGRYAVVEPLVPNTAYFIFDSIYMDRVKDGGVIDLNKVPHKRLYHSKRNNAMVKKMIVG